jgi:hypothetical protein
MTKYFLTAFLLCASASAQIIDGTVQLEGTVTLNGVGTTTNPPTADTTFAALTNNNTAACGGPNAPVYCYAVWGTSALPNLTTCQNSLNGCPGSFSAAQTQLLTPSGNISPITIPASYLYPGFNGQVILTGQPWAAPKTGSYTCYLFPTGGYRGGPSPYGNSAHPCFGYSENDARVITAQDAEMIALGQGGSNTVVRADDWYGNSNNQAFLNTSVTLEYQDILGRCGVSYASCTMGFSAMVDGGGFKDGMVACSSGAPSSNCAPGATSPGAAGCDPSACTVAQVEAYLEASLAYFDSAFSGVNWAPSPYNSAHRELILFITRGGFTGLSCSAAPPAENCWNFKIWPDVQTWQLANLNNVYDMFNSHWSAPH